jgi:hypothetical protein
MTTKANSMTNAHYAKTTSFCKACQQYMETSQPGLELDKIATRRQASKYRRGTGVVYKTINNLLQ